MMVQLISVLIAITATGLVALASDTREQVDPRPPACTSSEPLVGCTKHGELAKTNKTVERKTASKPDPIVALMDEISRLKQELVPTEPSNTKNLKPASVAVSVSSEPASSRSVCEKSLAVGTLGYRILCQPSKKVNVEQRHEITHEHQQSREAPKVASPTTAGDAAMSQERTDRPEQAEAGELRRLRSLFEQLNKRGNFRPIVESS